MSLTTGRGPLSSRPAGRFTKPVPKQVTYIEPFPRRVRGRKDGQVVVDSERVLLVHRPGQPPAYSFPLEDITDVASTTDPDTAGYASVAWDAVDGWYEEGEEVFGHPRNPYHRVDCLRAERQLSVSIAGTTLVDTTSTMAVYETALAPRLYVHRDHVRTDLLEPSSTQTYCPYKGTASYWSVRIGDEVTDDVAWSYEDPLPECSVLAGLLSFDETRVDLAHDLPPT